MILQFILNLLKIFILLPPTGGGGEGRTPPRPPGGEKRENIFLLISTNLHEADGGGLMGHHPRPLRQTISANFSFSALKRLIPEVQVHF